MATLPYFVLSPSTLLSMSGLFRGPDTIRKASAEDWRAAKVDVIIPALNEAENIVLCLASVLRQTLRPRTIVLVDDGSNDRTVEHAKAFSQHHGIELRVIQRRAPIGKTPTIKRQARELDSDVEFVLDADTVLESDNYIERTVQELYQAVGIASAFGTILPQRTKDRRQAIEWPEVRAFGDAHPANRPVQRTNWVRDLARGITNVYREVLYLYLQRFLYRGQMALFGTTTNPVGCAVAYRREYIRAIFDHIGPILGDDLTNSEDIFIGFSMLNEGYRNIQLPDVSARTVEPEIQRLPRQIYLWSSSFLQSCYYFDPLVRSPFKASKRSGGGRTKSGTMSAVLRVPEPILAYAGAGLTGFERRGAGTHQSGDHALRGSRAELSTADVGGRATGPLAVSGAATSGAANAADRRMIREPYRQPFGRTRTEEFGRPAGWILMMSAIEKVFFPTVLVIMVILGRWEALAVTAGAETAICALALVLVMKGRRLEYALKAFLVTPIRYGLLAFELVTIGRFAADLWITKNRRWRK